MKLEEVAPSASQARCRQLHCFAAWVRLGAMFEAETPHLDQFIQLAFQLTTSENEGKLCMVRLLYLDVITAALRHIPHA